MLQSLVVWRVLLTVTSAVALIVFLVVTQVLPGTAEAYARNFAIAAVAAVLWCYLVLQRRHSNNMLLAFIPFYIGVSILTFMPPDQLMHYTSILAPAGAGFTGACIALAFAPRLPWVAKTR